MIDEHAMLQMIKSSKKIVLLEPPYRRKYIPLGLAKIATMAKENGSDIVYQRKYTPKKEDLVCITSLFTYNSPEVLGAIQTVKFMNPNVDILIGGIYASLMPKHIHKIYPDIKIFTGYSKELDKTPPDYDMDWEIEDKWKKFSFVFTTRGCPNKCAYCAVWRIEPEQWVNPSWKKHIDLSKPYVMVSDNNFSAQSFSHMKSVCDYLKDKNKKVVFDNGFDCKHITPELAQMVGGLGFVRSGMRLAFDRIEEDGVFQKAIKTLKDNGVSKSALMAYVLFNFNDTPQEANYRMTECVKAGVRPYPQQYNPLNNLTRKKKHIGKHWTKNLLRTFRFFWLMAGYHTKMTFEEFVKQDNEYNLTEEDWKAWKKTI